MNVADFYYDLPDELIAQFPPKQRTDSRLLKLPAEGDIVDAHFADIIDEFRKGDLLVLNDTKVVPARIHGHKDTGGKLEIMLERVTGEGEFLAQLKASKAPRVGQKIFANKDDSVTLTVIGRQGSFFNIKCDLDKSLFSWFEKVGHIPLPPYIEREDGPRDADRYQTVFAEAKGAVAAPTAGLHYDDRLLQRIRAKGVQIETVTLHVGAGTYQPVRAERISEHEMHSEHIEVSERVCNAVRDTKAAGNRVIAVGTTVVRSLETAALASNDNELISSYVGDTDIFIYPGYKFRVVDLLQTNFHLPESTLLMLVSAFSGKDRIRQAYQHAIEQQYRFFSYGDAMLLERVR